jgi:hypothetical protein
MKFDCILSRSEDCLDLRWYLFLRAKTPKQIEVKNLKCFCLVLYKDKQEAYPTMFEFGNFIPNPLFPNFFNKN